MNKYGKRLNLENIKVDITDTDPNSTYFGVSEISTIFTSGKNSLSINGSNLLMDGSDILIEILDYDNDPLYVEVGRSYGKTIYRDGVSIVFSVHVYSDTPKGTGTIYIAGTDINGSTVRWSKKIEINPTILNTSKVRFYNNPTFTVDPFINITSQYSTSSTQESQYTGTFFGTPINPPKNSRIDYFDSTRQETKYQINLLTGSPFSSSMIGNEISFGTGLSANITDVLNNTSIIIDKPFLDGKLVVSTSSTYSIVHTPYKTYQGETNKKIGTAEVIFKNIETFTGNVYRYKIYRSSLNAPYDAELVSDGFFYGNELLNDSESPRRSTSNLGSVDSHQQLIKYWKSVGSISMSQDSSIIIDGIKMSGMMSNQNSNKSSYIMAKLSGSNSNYIPYDETDFTTYDNRTAGGSSYKTNFIRMYENVEYELTANVYCEKSSDSVDSKIQFYITSSMPSIISHKNYDGYGLLIGSCSYNSTEKFNGNKKNFGTIKNNFTINKDLNGTLVMVPSNGDYTVSNISIKPYTDFSFNPQTFTIRVPFDAKTENEGFNITCELFDINQNSVFRGLTTTKFFDPKGETYPFNFLYSLISGSTDTAENAFNEALNVAGNLTLLSSSYIQSSASFETRINTNTSTSNTALSKVTTIESYLTPSSIQLDNGSGTWRIRCDGSDLSIERLTGTGAVDISNGTPFKLFGGLVSTGSANSGGTGFKYLRIPN